MATVINNPPGSGNNNNNDGGNGMGTGIVVGVIIALIIIAFFVYVLPALRSRNNPAPQTQNPAQGTSTSQVNLPGRVDVNIQGSTSSNNQ